VNNQRLLLLRLRIKRDTKRIEDAVEWNFGCCPHYEWFDKLLVDNRLDLIEYESLKLELFLKHNVK
jgi:hypothetical protein